MNDTIRVRRIDVWVHRFPLKSPIVTSFGVMADRPALSIRLEDADGTYGFGEVWCNFPSSGAEHRARLLIEELSGLVFNLDVAHPSDFFTRLTKLTHIHVLQAGEPGPYAQAIAGLDVAAWDICARRARIPIRKLLNVSASDEVSAYASGIHIRYAADMISHCRAAGHRAFKVKVGFDLKDDCVRLKEMVAGLGENELLFCDANQSWDIETAIRFIDSMGDAAIGWLEEPLPADSPDNEWKRLAMASAIPLAASENIASTTDFKWAIESGSFAYIQPDIAKWGGFTGCLQVARSVAQAGRTYCPHYLGGGIGLLASANLLAAVGGAGFLELDVNLNPLRDAFLEEHILTAGGSFQLSSDSGLGVTELPGELSQFEVMHQTVTA